MSVPTCPLANSAALFFPPKNGRFPFEWCFPCGFPFNTQPTKKKAQVISPTACGALFSARTTLQPSQNLVEPSWNPGGTLVEPHLRAGPPRSLSGLRPQSFQLGSTPKNNEAPMSRPEELALMAGDPASCISMARLAVAEAR